ncbi:MAG: hypothetical protein FWE40_03545 [Oscillospiraceae bacterium]|nr:hypothetical protein [Oscillospiraceae bacterium]
MHSIEKVINKKLSGDVRQNALDFVSFMQANEMPLDQTDDWFKYQGENICTLIFGVCEAHNMSGNGDNWSIYWANCDVCWGEGDVVDKATEDLAFRSPNPCGKCPCEHSPGFRKTVFGKVYENACYSTFCFDNPSAEELKHIKTLAKMRKQNIAVS